MNDVPEEIFPLSAENLKMLRSASRDIFYVLKPIFEKGHRGFRPYGSVADYKQKQEMRYRHPESYFCFQDNNVVILIALRRGLCYSVGVTGVNLHSDVLQAMAVPDDYFSEDEKKFSGGMTFYGHFGRNSFGECLNLWLKCIVQYIFQRFDADYHKVFEQLELIF